MPNPYSPKFVGFSIQDFFRAPINLGHIVTQKNLKTAIPFTQASSLEKHGGQMSRIWKPNFLLQGVVWNSIKVEEIFTQTLSWKIYHETVQNM